MPYAKRTVVAGAIRETRLMYTSRIHSEGAERSKNCGHTSAAQARVNERKIEETLRWRLNANFGAGDFHLVLHYYDKEVTLEAAEADRSEFLRLLRLRCRREKIPWKFVACTETKRMTNVHHHIILPAMDVAMLSAVWERVVGATGGGNISIKPLDRRGNHGKLARYLMKETKSTAERYREKGKRYKRFTTAQGMVMPEPTYTVVAASSWRQDPRPHKDYVLLKDDNGATSRSGIHEISGWPWMEYTEMWVGDGAPPGRRKKRPERQRRIKK